jgi:membrane-associated phospholipid phosphatase
MDPTLLDLRIVHLFGPLETKSFWVDATDTLSQTALVNGFVYAFSLFLFWPWSENSTHRPSQRVMLTIFIGSIIGVLGSAVLQHLIHWPAPASYPSLKPLYALHSPQIRNANSFPSDSATVYSTVAFGVAAYSKRLSIALIVWLLIVVAPIKIFVGAHYPTDILTGLLLGFCSLELARILVTRLPQIENFVVGFETLFRSILFLWLFEIGNEFKDVGGLLQSALHLRRHL